MDSLKNLSELVFEYADEEFHGRSFHGHSLIETLRQLDEISASDTNTYEGYCAWEILNHVCYCKILVVRGLNALYGNPDDSGYMDGIEPIPFEFKDFAPIPESRPSGSWNKVIDYFERVHKNCMNAIKDVKPEMLAMTMPDWKFSYGKIIAWLFTHDTYHNAQIRNMGIPGLKEKKIGT